MSTAHLVFAAIAVACVVAIVLMLVGVWLMDKSAAERQVQLKEGRD